MPSATPSVAARPNARTPERAGVDGGGDRDDDRDDVDDDGDAEGSGAQPIVVRIEPGQSVVYRPRTAPPQDVDFALGSHLAKLGPHIR